MHSYASINSPVFNAGCVKSDALISGLIRLRLLETPGGNANAFETNHTQCGFCNTPVFPEHRFDRNEFLDSEVLRADLSCLESVLPEI